MKRKIKIALSLIILSVGMSGCQGKVQQDKKEKIIEIAQNDYAGAYQRLTILQNDVLDKMSILENHNYKIMEGNPDDYWSDADFYFLHFLPVYDDYLQYTSVLNEIDNWADIQAYMKQVFENAGYKCETVLKKEPNNYKLQYSGTFTDTVNWQESYGKMTLDCIYDPSSNRMQVDSELSMGNYIISDFYQFAELSKGKYAIQNGTERLYTEYDETGNLVNFYYSVLPTVESVNIQNFIDSETATSIREKYNYNGEINVYRVLTAENIYVWYLTNGDSVYFAKDPDKNHYIITEAPTIPVMKASASGYYNPEDNSIYNDLKKIDKDWVFEAGAFKETIAYENQEIKASSTNIFTGEIKEFLVQETDVTDEKAEK